MRRYLGDDLGVTPKIAVVANDALGNFVVATPLMQMLRAKYPRATIVYFGGRRTAELQAASDLMDAQFPLHGNSIEEARDFASTFEPFDWVINLEVGEHAKSFAGQLKASWITGPCQVEGEDLPYGDDERARLWKDQDWIAADLTMKYPFLRSGFIGEIFCRLCYLEGPIAGYRVPTEEPPTTADVLIAMSASLPEKLWPVERWIALTSALASKGLGIGLLGAKPSAQAQFWKGSGEENELISQGVVRDLRGSMSLPQVCGALARAKLVVTLDNGILHLAVAGGAPTVGLYRHGIHRLWAPPYPNLSIVVPPEGSLVSSLSVEEVLRAAELAL